MELDSDSALVSPIPTFARPPMLTLDDPLPEDPESQPSPSPSDLSEQTTPKPSGRLARTATSATEGPSKTDLKMSGELVASLIGLVAVGAAALVAWKSRRQTKLREPSTFEAQAIGGPLGRILARHVDVSVLNPDVADLIEAGAATGRYLRADALIQPMYPDAGVPNDLQSGENQ